MIRAIVVVLSLILVGCAEEIKEEGNGQVKDIKGSEQGALDNTQYRLVLRNFENKLAEDIEQLLDDHVYGINGEITLEEGHSFVTSTDSAFSREDVAYVIMVEDITHRFNHDSLTVDIQIIEPVSGKKLHNPGQFNIANMQAYEGLFAHEVIKDLVVRLTYK